MIRSPFFYVGDKYKLMPQLIEYIPNNINNYYEPFLGGGSSFLNVAANNYHLNDINSEMIALHKLFKSESENIDEFYKSLILLAREYNLSISSEGDEVPIDLKLSFKKTYYAKYNKEAYLRLRNDYNKSKDLKSLYLLLIYGFNHMIRFNNKAEFNLPVGNVDFNNNTKKAIHNYLNIVKNRKITFYNEDYKEFILNIIHKDDDYIYLDPPYLISNSEYNKIWCEEQEVELYALIDKLNDKGIKFGLSNVVIHKGKTNNILQSWMSKYKVIEIKSNYISFNDNKAKQTREVFITNV